MKNIEKIIFTAIFVFGLGIYAVLSITNSIGVLSEYVDNLEVNDADDISDAIDELDTTIKDNVAFRYGVIETYGAVNKLLGKNEINGFEYVRDKNGFLSLGNFWNVVYDIDEKELAVNLEQFYERLQEDDIDMIFLSFPQKVSEEWTDGYSGIPYDDYSYEMNQFMIQVRKYRIPNIDMQKVLENSEMDYDELFYKTDHHWTSTAAFLGFSALVDKLEEMDIVLDPTGYYRELDNYEIAHYENMMFGSSGRSTGLIYAGGKEDFDLIYINDNTEYEFSLSSDEVMRGNISETLLDFNIPEDILNNPDAIYSRSMYDMYMRGIRKEMRITNKSNTDGPRVLLISDSYASPYGVWLAPMCSEVDFLWANHNTGEEIETAIEENDYDLVIVGFYPNDMNEDFIHFGTEN